MLRQAVLSFLRWFEIKYAVSFACTVALWFVREESAFVWALIVGSVVNGVLGKVLKASLNQQRPSSAPSNNKKKHDPGMPSGHANTMFFMVGLLTTYFQQPLWSVVLMYATAALFTAVRVYVLEVHTLAQALVGCCLGSLTSRLLLGPYLLHHPDLLRQWNVVLDQHYYVFVGVKVLLTVSCVIYYAVEPFQLYYKTKGSIKIS